MHSHPPAQQIPMPVNARARETSTRQRHIALTVLVLQNTLLVLMMRQSRSTCKPDQALYNPATAVFLSEVLKTIFCFATVRYKRLGGAVSWNNSWRNEVTQMLIPSALYAVQNNLLYIALSNLEAATFQITYQLKILSTAIFSVILLNRKITRKNWIALILLMLGVTLVQTQTATTDVASSSSNDKPLLGLVAVLACCVSSGFAGCYFEKSLKTSDTSMWVRNIQLGLCSLVFSAAGLLVNDWALLRSNGFFYGYNGLVWLVICNQAAGGLIVASVVKYADSILKAFATSISILLSSCISYYLFDFRVTWTFALGAAIVLYATYLYGKPEQVTISSGKYL